MYRIKEPNTPMQCSAGHVEFQLSAAAKPSGGGGGSATGAAGGDLAGSYPNPSVVKIQGQPISATLPANGQVLTFSGGAWTPQTPFSASIPINISGAYDLSNVNGLLANGTSNTGNIPASGPGIRMEWIGRWGAFRAGQVQGTQWDEGKVGNSSAAFGLNTTASGSYSFAAGYGTSATGVSSTAFGTNTVASSFGSFAAGNGSTASSTDALAIGTAANAGGPQAVALGGQANASREESVAIGYKTTASGIAAVAIGDGATASADNAFSIGYLTVANGAYSTAMGNRANTAGMSGSFVYGDVSTNNTIGAPLDNSFVVRAQHFWFGTTSAPAAPSGHLIETSTGAYLSTGGTWTNTSDVNKKHAFKSVDAEDLLARIDAMPVSTWTYNTELDSVRHMGPTAQDFRKAFGLGDTDKAIATVDADGVSLAAVKALIQRTTKLSDENVELRERVTHLSTPPPPLRSMIAELAQRLSLIEQSRR